MMVTEEQARTKACPKALAPDSYSETFAVNRERDEVHSSCRCIASGCMAWDWAGKARETIRNYHDAPVVQRIEGNPYAYHSYPDGWRYEHTDADRDGRKFDLLHRVASDDAPTLGYCSAFSRPEA